MTEANFRDFTKKRPEIYFDLNGERYHCRKALTPKKLQLAMRAFRSIKSEFDAVVDTSDAAEKAENTDLLGKIAGVLIHFLKVDSFDRLNAALNDDEPDEPIDVEQLMEILKWTLETMTGRPTTPSPDSTDTSPSDGTGTSSTAGAQLEASTLSS